MQWCIEIGIFNATSKARYFKKKDITDSCSCFLFLQFWISFCFLLLILFVCRDTELNSVPKNRNSCHNFSICHWNLNTIAAHNFAKANLLQAYNVIHDFDMIGLSKSYLDSSVSSDSNLCIKDYKLVRADHPGNVKSGGVCIYFKESLSVSCVPKPYLKGCLMFEVSINNKKGYIVSVYRSPSQTSNDFNSFTTNFEKLVTNISSINLNFIFMIGDFKAKLSNRSSNDTMTAVRNPVMLE